jgi:hypothetical protein
MNLMISLYTLIVLTERFSVVKRLQSASCKFQLAFKEILRFLNMVRINTPFLVL